MIQCLPLKYLADFRGGCTPKDKTLLLDNGGIDSLPWLLTEDLNNGFITTSKYNIKNEALKRG